MMSMGAVRLALEGLSREDGKRSMVELLEEAFDALEARG